MRGSYWSSDFDDAVLTRKVAALNHANSETSEDWVGESWCFDNAFNNKGSFKFMNPAALFDNTLEAIHTSKFTNRSVCTSHRDRPIRLVDC
ncbi:hypothetical protein RRG08_060585 [Elysia crispata]|uniref:Uncharacterized protein n=1 Tax=Elysia crispata TaxID=231223 RepID=A0AAE1AMR8_9GAST|nr:hypothetical protein RRG08_060585 [Elysia crispata]